MKDSVSTRIALMIKELDMNVSSFSKAIGLTNNVTIGRIISEEREPGFQVLSKIKQTFDSINANWLITGKGGMFLGSEGHAEKVNLTSLLPNTGVRYKKSQYVPLYSMETSTGLTDFFRTENKHEVDHIYIPNLPHCDGAIHIVGDSMSPLLKSGDVVLYKQVCGIINDIFWGEMYLISIESGGEEFICTRYIQKSEIPDHVKLISYNEHHQPKDVHQKKIRALALVKASIRINSMR